jgi:hypothetical protein
MNISEAIHLVNNLRPPEEGGIVYRDEVEKYREAMKGKNFTRDAIKIMQPTPEDLTELRCMLVAELTNKPPRLPLVMSIINKHETLYRKMRVQPLLDALPALAVAVERATPESKRPPPTGGAALQNAITGALHGRTED